MLKPIACAASFMLVCGTAFAALPTVKLNSQYRNTANNTFVTAPVSYENQGLVSKTSDITTAIGKNYVGKPYTSYTGNNNGGTAADLRQDIAKLEGQISEVLEGLSDLSDKVDRVAEESEIPSNWLLLPDIVNKLEKVIDKHEQDLQLVDDKLQKQGDNVDKLINKQQKQDENIKIVYSKLNDVEKTIKTILEDGANADVTELKKNIETLKGTIESLQKTDQQVWDRINDKLEPSINKNAKNIQELRSDLQNAELAIINLQNEVGNLKASIADFETRIKTLEDNLKK